MSLFASGLYVALLMGLAVATTAPTRRVRRGALTLFAAGSIAAAFAALWFTGLQLFVVKHFCLYCLLVHGCSLLLGALALTMLGLPRVTKLVAGAVGFFAVGLLATAQLVAAPKPTFEIESFPPAGNSPLLVPAPGEDSEPGIFEAPESGDNPSQSVSEPGESSDSGNEDRPEMYQVSVGGSWRLAWAARPAMSLMAVATTASWPIQEPADSGARTDEKSEPAQDETATPQADDEATDRIANFGNSFRLKVASWPLVGDPEAPHIIVEMFDYTCPYCRANHRWVREAQAKSDAKFAIISLPVPMNRECNPSIATTDPAHRDACKIAELSVAVWLTDPEKYPEYHEWLFAGHQVPTAADAKRQAETLVGADKVQESLNSGTPRAYVAKQVELYRKLGGGKVPKLLFSQTILTGDVGSPQRIHQILRQEQARN